MSENLEERENYRGPSPWPFRVIGVIRGRHGPESLSAKLDSGVVSEGFWCVLSDSGVIVGAMLGDGLCAGIHKAGWGSVPLRYLTGSLSLYSATVSSSSFRLCACVVATI